LDVQVNFELSQLKNLELQLFRVIQTSLDRRTAVFVNPKRKIEEERYDGVKFSKKKLDILVLILLTWYSDYFQGFNEYVRYEIGEYLQRNLLFPELNASLVSKEISLGILFLSGNFHTRKIFGSILTKERIDRVLDEIELLWIRPKRISSTVYRRGYKDHGSLRLASRWLPTKDWSLDNLHLELEQRRQEYSEKTSLLVHYFGDLVIKKLMYK